MLYGNILMLTSTSHEKTILLASSLQLLFLNSCEKKSPYHSFDYLITKDVQWNFHFQGHVFTTPYGIEFDTSYHRYIYQ